MFLFSIWKLSPKETYLVIGLSVVALLCLIGIIVLCVRSKKKSNGDNDSEKLVALDNDSEAIEPAANNDEAPSSDTSENAEVKEAEKEAINLQEEPQAIQSDENKAEVESKSNEEPQPEETSSSQSPIDVEALNESETSQEENPQEENTLEENVQEESTKEEDDEDEDDDDEAEDEEVLSTPEQANSQEPLVLVNYIKSFRAKLSMTNEDARNYYELIKNYLLSYKLKSRMSWSCETIYKGRVAYAKLTIRGKNLNVNLALNPQEFENTKYYFKDTSDSKKYEMVPMRLKVKSPRSYKYACELIDIMLQKAGFAKLDNYQGAAKAEDIRSFDENLTLGLIKKVKGRKASLEEIAENRITKEMLDSSYIPEVSYEDVEGLEIDDEILEMVQEILSSKRKSGKKSIVNLDVINRAYNENEVVSVETLRKKKIISKNIGQVKCLARGTVNKALIYELEDYSDQAVKMILLTGGEIR